MADLRYLPRRQALQNTRYPFADAASLRNAAGDELPLGLFLDAVFYPIGNALRLWLSAIVVAADTVTLQFAGPAGPLCAVAFARGTVPSQLALTDPYGRPAGLLLCDAVALTRVAGWTLGEHLFQPTETPLVPDVVIPTPEIGVRGLILESGEVFTGDVWLVGEDGVQFRVTDHAIQLDAVGDPLFLRKGCDTEAGGGVMAGPFLKTINTRHPDSAGHFLIYPDTDLVVDTVLRIEPRAHGLFFKILATAT